MKRYFLLITIIILLFSCNKKTGSYNKDVLGTYYISSTIIHSKYIEELVYDTVIRYDTIEIEELKNSRNQIHIYRETLDSINNCIDPFFCPYIYDNNYLYLAEDDENTYKGFLKNNKLSWTHKYHRHIFDHWIILKGNKIN